MNNTMDPNTDEAKTDEAKTDKNLWLNSTFNSFNQQGEWMVDRFFIPTEKFKLIAKLILSLGFGTNCRIWIPGIGTSHLAFVLIHRYGFSNVTATDIHPKAIEYQHQLFKTPSNSFHIFQRDIFCLQTISDTTHLYDPFDVIIDSSVTDVYFAEDKKAVHEIQERMYAKLSRKSVMIILSMNHRLWIPHLTKYDEYMYASIEQYSGSLRNPKNMRRDISLFVCSQGFKLSTVNEPPIHELMNIQNNRKCWLYNPKVSELHYQITLHGIRS